jgi:phosphoribosylformylglycinamidine synthase
MAQPKVLVLTGYGINCDEESKFAFEKAGAKADIVHINDLINGEKQLKDYEILCFPGGFSYGDDTGSGNAFANKIRNHMWGKIEDFVNDDKLAIGVCNGFQVMVNLGLLPGFKGEYGQRKAALLHNNTARYNCRWVDLKFTDHSPWTKDIGEISLPMAHGEGRFYAEPDVLLRLYSEKMIAAQYVKGMMHRNEGLPYNPNGSLEDIASITDSSGRLIGMMPHPERAIAFTQRPDWTAIKEQYKRLGTTMPKEGKGLKLFRNAVEYFR